MFKLLTCIIFAFNLLATLANADFIHNIELGTKIKVNKELVFNNQDSRNWSIHFQNSEEVLKAEIKSDQPFCRAHSFIVVADSEPGDVPNAELDFVIPKETLIDLNWVLLKGETNPSERYSLTAELNGNYSKRGSEDNSEYFRLHCFPANDSPELLTLSDLRDITGNVFDFNNAHQNFLETTNITDPLDLPFGCIDTLKGCVGVSKLNSPSFNLDGLKNIKGLEYKDRDNYFNYEQAKWFLVNNQVKGAYDFEEGNNCEINQTYVNSFESEYYDEPQPINFVLDGTGELLPHANLNFPRNYSFSIIHSPYYNLEKSVFKEEITQTSYSALTFNLPPSNNDGSDFYPLEIFCRTTDFKILTYRDVLAHISDYFEFQFTKSDLK